MIGRLIQAARRFFGHGLGRRVRFPVDRLGYVLETSGGERYRLYRETRLDRARDTGEGAVVSFRLSVPSDSLAAGLRSALFDPISNIATPFFAGQPGFRRKLWLAGSDGEFLELYEWDSQEDAERFVETLQSVLRPFELLGTAKFEITENATVEEFIRGSSMGWDGSARKPPMKSRLATAAVVGGLLLAAMLVIRTIGRRRQSSG
ncbi:MAG: hypothetical protein ABEH64_13730 [Salinirussus sp.]